MRPYHPRRQLQGLEMRPFQDQWQIIMARSSGVEYCAWNGEPSKTMAAKVAFTEATENEWPICPSCKKELRELKFKRRGWLTSITVFWYPHCLCLLSTSTTLNG